MKKLLIFISLFVSLASYSQVQQQFGAVADNLDSLRTHVGKNHQYVVILNVIDSTGGLYYYDSLSVATEVTNKVFKVTGKDTGRWFFVEYFDASGSLQNLQSVTDIGDTTTNNIIVDNSRGFSVLNGVDEQGKYLSGDIEYYFGDHFIGIVAPNPLDSDYTLVYPKANGTLVATVNGVHPDDKGNVVVSGSSGITALTGDVTASGSGSVAATLATVNSNVGSFGDATHVGAFTVNGKGLITAASSTAITGFASSTLTNTHLFVGNGSNVATDVAASGDLGLANTGAFTIAQGAVTDDKASLLVKPAVAVVSTSNLTLSGEQTIDGQLTSTSTVLLTGQTSGSENGFWVTASGAWARPTWYANGSTTQAPRFLTTFIRLGTLYQGTTWRMTTASVTIGTTATTWVETPMVLNSTSVTGTLPIANGGTNNGSLSVTSGTVYYGDGTKLLGLAPGTSSQILHGGTTPSWKDTTAAGGAGAWSTSGNAGTHDTATFLGTTSNTNLLFKTNGTQRVKIDSVGGILLGTANAAATYGAINTLSNGNVVFGNSSPATLNPVPTISLGGYLGGASTYNTANNRIILGGTGGYGMGIASSDIWQFTAPTSGTFGFATNGSTTPMFTIGTSTVTLGNTTNGTAFNFLAATSHANSIFQNATSTGDVQIEAKNDAGNVAVFTITGTAYTGVTGNIAANSANIFTVGTAKMLISTDWGNSTSSIPLDLAPGGYAATIAQRIVSGKTYFGAASTATSTVQVGGSFGAAYVAKTANFTATIAEHTINFTSGTDTLTLPTAVGIVREYTIVNSGSGTIHIVTTSSQTFTNINGTPIFLDLAPVGAAAITSYTFESNGANWIVTGKVKNE